MLWSEALFVQASVSERAGHSACAMCARAVRGDRSASRNSNCLLGRRFAARWVKALRFADMSLHGVDRNDATGDAIGLGEAETGAVLASLAMAPGTKRDKS